jgi:multidrug resistance efflux pump
MTQRNPALVFVLSLVTLGIYAIVWYVMTKEEMNRTADAQIPTAWLLIIPFVNIFWIWKFSEGVEKTTNKDTSGGLAFVLLFLLGVIGMAIIQSGLNKVASPAAA